MRRRQLLKTIPAATVGLGAIGTASAGPDTPSDSDSDLDDRVDDGPLPDSAYHDDHPVEAAMEFTWYDGSDWRVDAGPQVLLFMKDAGGRWVTAAHSRDYAEYIYNSHPVWQEYNSISNLDDMVSKHMFDPDGIAGITLWEVGYGTNNPKPDDWEYEKSDFDDWRTDL